ncbi:hypothetical protein Glove_372g100 [Diversispora epigaea]|uniref:Tc1-like transposase DDE domain-containing protein n=1 Tax=Diversispora epigaea TaxID=1348612 RepID=A0A397H6F6_9GLOM|nr:hypothetical protein Glove_372g100 [Diversispora epigaea]
MPLTWCGIFLGCLGIDVLVMQPGELENKELEASNYILVAQTKELEPYNIKPTSQNKQMKKLKASNAELADQMKKIKTSNSELAAYKKDSKLMQDIERSIWEDVHCTQRITTCYMKNQIFEQERKEFTRVLNKELWKYFHDTGILIRNLELLIPATSDRHNFISLTPVDDGKTKATESNLSDDSYQLKSNNLRTVASENCVNVIWLKLHPKLMFRQDNSLQKNPNSPDLNPIENIWKSLKVNILKQKKILKAVDELKTALSKEWSKFDATNNRNRIGCKEGQKSFMYIYLRLKSNNLRTVASENCVNVIWLKLHPKLMFRQDNSLQKNPNSPDLNPIENIWKSLKVNILKQKKILKAVDELKTALSKEWSKFDATNNRNRIGCKEGQKSFMQRLNQFQKEWEAWMDNLIIEDTLQKGNIPFYQYSEFEDVKSISGNVYKVTFKTSQKCWII